MFSRFFNSEWQIPVDRRLRLEKEIETVEARLTDITEFYGALRTDQQMFSAREFIRLTHDVAFLSQVVTYLIKEIRDAKIARKKEDRGEGANAAPAANQGDDSSGASEAVANASSSNPAGGGTVPLTGVVSESGVGRLTPTSEPGGPRDDKTERRDAGGAK